MKTLKIKLRPGTKLSESFANSRDCYKVVEINHPLGHCVALDGSVVYALYRAEIYVKVGKVGQKWVITPSYEYGPRLNGFTFNEDDAGCTLAMIAGHAVRALEHRATTALPRKSKKPGKKGA